MRKLSDREAVSLERYTKQRKQLRRIEQLSLVYKSSNALIDRIVGDIGDEDDALMARLMARKAANYQARVHRTALLRFVKKLIALSEERLRTIKELKL